MGNQQYVYMNLTQTLFQTDIDNDRDSLCHIQHFLTFNRKRRTEYAGGKEKYTICFQVLGGQTKVDNMPYKK